jgi:hypothetical protein
VKFFPKSIGMPPPESAATGFGRYAGSIIQIAESNDRINKSILIMQHSNTCNKQQIQTLRLLKSNSIE